MRKVFAIIMVMFVTTTLDAQIVTDNNGANGSANYLVDQILRGQGMQTFNVTLTGGTTDQIGYFTDASQSIGFGDGVIFCTGDISVAEGDNSTGNASTAAIGTFSDPDIDALAGGQTVEDPLVIEFDFVPIGDQVTLEFVFASEEYPENVCSQVADVMGAFISGPGINGPFSNNADNMMVLPTSGDNIGINTVNNGAIGSNGVAGGCGTSGLNNTQYFIENTDSLYEFDGRTVVMQVGATVECRQTYHMKIVLADVGDAQSESTLLFRTGGLYSNGIGIGEDPLYADSAIVEGCKPQILYFARPGGGPAQTIDIDISGTAINGVDYDLIGSTIQFSPTDSTAFIEIDAIDDGVVEGPESVIISFSVVNPCGDSIPFSFTVWIMDNIPMTLTYDDFHQYCEGDQVFLSADVTGGFPPHGYNWDTIQGNNIFYDPGQDVTLTLTVYDAAGCGVSGQVVIDYGIMPTVDAGANFSMCQNETVVLGGTIDGGPGATYVWSPSTGLDDPNSPNPTLSNPTSSTTYSVVVTTPEGCENSDAVFITTLNLPFVDGGPDHSIVYYQESATLQGTGWGTPFWAPSEGLSCTDCFTPIAGPGASTYYVLHVTGANGCIAKDTVYVEVLVPTDVFIPTGFSPNGDGHNDLFRVRGYTISYMDFRVYDKWGQEVYQGGDPNLGWDGTIRGDLAEPGVYSYVAVVHFVNNAGMETFSGEVTLVR